jgi:hypothetical protein
VCSTAKSLACREAHSIFAVNNLARASNVKALVKPERTWIAVPARLTERGTGIQISRRRQQSSRNRTRQASVTTGNIAHCGKTTTKGRRQATRCSQGNVTERSHLDDITMQADSVCMEMGVNEAWDDGAAGRIDVAIVGAHFHVTNLNNLTVVDSYPAFRKLR